MRPFKVFYIGVQMGAAQSEGQRSTSKTCPICPVILSPKGVRHWQFTDKTGKFGEIWGKAGASPCPTIVLGNLFILISKFRFRVGKYSHIQCLVFLFPAGYKKGSSCFAGRHEAGIICVQFFGPFYMKRHDSHFYFDIPIT